MSRTVYLIMYPGCPELWCSKKHTEIDLSTTEVEYISLIQATTNVIPFMALKKEVSFILDIHPPNSEVFCKVFGDNQSCISVAESNNFRPRTKYIAIQYHHLRKFIQFFFICICYINTR